MNPNKTVKVYVIKYESGFKYYSPAPITGNTITKSYYESIFDYEKYKNCTLSSTMDIKMSLSMSYQGQAENMNIVSQATQLIKYADNKIYMEQTATGSGEGETYTSVIYAYMEIVEDEIKCYVKLDDSTEWSMGSLTTIGFSSLEELTPFYDQYLDYSYFTKTDYGFEIADENAQKYIQETLAGNDAVASIGSYLNAMNIEMFAKFYVSNGVLSGMREDASLKMNVNESGMAMNIDMTVKMETSCKNYGTTVVEKPFTE